MVRTEAELEQRPENQYEPLWSVDPGSAVERLPSLPASRDLGVPPFVGRERSRPEGETYEEREADGRSRSERWGPPVQGIDRGTAALAAGGLFLALAAMIAVFGLALTIERMLLVLLVPALVLRRGRVFLHDFLPFAALLILYAEFRGLAHSARAVPYYVPQLDAEKLFFGGHVPAEVLQRHFYGGVMHLHDTLLLDLTRVHSIVPPLLAFGLWLRRRALFYRFAATMVTLSFAAAFVFIAFPSAPPWAAAQAGFGVHVQRIGHAPSSLPYLSIYHYVDSNPYAAIPSLHAGYAFFLFLFVATLAWRTRWRWPVILLTGIYPLAQSFAAVYTGNHYVVDLLIGYTFAAGAVFGVRAFWRRRGWPE
jgi:membrane-associated phospholipid phosphatase